MKKPRMERGTTTTQAVPIVAVLLLLIANGHTIVITIRPLCGWPCLNLIDWRHGACVDGIARA